MVPPGKTVIIGTGRYEITELNQELTRLMKINNHYDTANYDIPYITLSPNLFETYNRDRTEATITK